MIFRDVELRVNIIQEPFEAFTSQLLSQLLSLCHVSKSLLPAEEKTTTKNSTFLGTDELQLHACADLARFSEARCCTRVELSLTICAHSPVARADCGGSKSLCTRPSRPRPPSRCSPKLCSVSKGPFWGTRVPRVSTGGSPGCPHTAKSGKRGSYSDGKILSYIVMYNVWSWFYGLLWVEPTA